MNRNAAVRPDVTWRLAVAGLHVDRGGRTVIDDLTFEVASGTALVVTGPNGAGKTTLLRAIAGFVAPVAGSVRFAPDDPAGTAGEDTAPVAELCHYVGHLNAIKPTLTVIENLAFAARLLAPHMRAPEATVAAAIDRMGLSGLADVPAGLLSAGQKRRLCLARLLVAERPLWLLDEPTVSLDVASTRLLTGLIEAHVAAGGLAIVVTHIPLDLAAAQDLRLEPRRRSRPDPDRLSGAVSC